QASGSALEGCGLRHGITALRLVRAARKRFELARLASVLQPQPADLALLQPFPFAAAAAHPKLPGLFVLDALRFAQPVHFGVLEPDREQIAADGQVGTGITTMSARPGVSDREVR